MSAPRTLDVQAFINQRRFSAYQWLVLALCFLIVAIDGFDTAMVGYFAPALVHDWGVDKAALGPLMSAALFGLAIGSLCAGPLADRFGRKPVLVLSVWFFGVASLAAARAGSLESLTALRFLTGLGLGAAMSNALTLMSEYAPDRRRSVLVNTVFCGFPVGAALGGLLASWLIPQFGWRSVLFVGGVAPLALGLLLIVLLPESVRYMVARGKPVETIRRVLARVTQSSLDDVGGFTFSESKVLDGRSALGLVLSRPYLLGSMMLWLTYFMGLLIFYLLTSWMPLLMKDAGFTVGKAAMMTALFPLGGGIGTILAGWLMDRINPHKVVATAYLLTGGLIFAVGQGGSVALLSLLIFLAGTTMNSAQSSMGSIAAGFYPTHCRATGVAWMLGMGRFGGISGALIGAGFMRWNLGFSSIFTFLAVPALIAALALTVKNAHDARQARGAGAVPGRAGNSLDAGAA
jgi:AAHS family 4-hydroxybenzoate transporter-like MFS transporter